MGMQDQEIEGSLRVFKFPEILQFLSMGKRTGILRVSRADRGVELAFRDGKLVSVLSKERYSNLGQALIYTGRINRDQLDEALELQELSQGVKPLSDILVDKGFIDIAELKAALRLQLEDELWELYSWDTGNFRFEQSPVVDVGAVTVELDVSRILEEGSRRMEEWQELSARINDPNEVFVVNREFDGPPENPLDAKTWRILALVNGRLNVESIVRFSNLGKFETYWALDRLLRGEIIARQSAEVHPSQNQIPVAGNPAAASMPAQISGNGESFADDIEEGGKSLLGLFSRKKSAPQPGSGVPQSLPPVQADSEYDTDVALVCDATNQLLDFLQMDPAMAPGASIDPYEKIWEMCCQRFPRADMIGFRGGRLDSSLLDHYARREGRISRALSGSRDDSLEAVWLFWHRVVDLAEEQISGEGNVRAIVEHVSHAFTRPTVSIGESDFTFRSWRLEGIGPKVSD